MIARLPGVPVRMSDPPRSTSMCMEIAGFSHEDCPGGWCCCECHLPIVPTNTLTTLATTYPLGPDWPIYLRTPSAANSPIPRPAVPQQPGPIARGSA